MRVVSPEERGCYFYTKSIRALSKLSFERLPAMCWTCLKISGNPVFKTQGTTCRNLEINPSIEISLSSVTALCSVQCIRMHLLHAFSASVKNSLLFFLWIFKSEPMPWNTVNCRLFATVKNASSQMSHNALDRQIKHLDPVSHATPKWRISAFTYKPSSSLMGPYHSCKPNKNKQTNKQTKNCPNISLSENNTLPSSFKWI